MQSVMMDRRGIKMRTGTRGQSESIIMVINVKKQIKKVIHKKKIIQKQTLK